MTFEFLNWGLGIASSIGIVDWGLGIGIGDWDGGLGIVDWDRGLGLGTGIED